jgi:acetolactate decarboxylase
MHYCILSFILLCAACDHAGSSDHKVTHNTDSIHPEVRIKGMLRDVIRNGKIKAAVSMDTIDVSDDFLALGPLENLRGEITAVAGKIYVSSVVNDSVVVRTDRQAKAPLLVYSKDKIHAEKKLPDDVVTLDDLEKYLDGFQSETAFAFTVHATARTLVGHVFDLPSGSTVHSHEDARKYQKTTTLTDTKVILVGFYSQQHHGVFTHHDSNVHIHVLTDDKKYMGHLESIVMQRGALLKAGKSVKDQTR